jgi:hypothetical protein
MFWPKRGIIRFVYFSIFNIRPDSCFGPNILCDVNKILFYSKIIVVFGTVLTSYVYNIKGRH